MILFAIFCIIIISVFVISKFSFARLLEEHLEDMDSLSDGKKVELRELYNGQNGLWIRPLSLFSSL